MKRTGFTLRTVFLVFISLGAMAWPGFLAATPLNVVFIMVDDLGWTDLGCMGSTYYETPHIDLLAEEGMRFTSAYSACTVCSPTRAAYQTGQYPARLHLTDWIEGHKRPRAKLNVPDWTMYLPLEATTIAEVLKQAGYATIHIGKWHLGGEDYRPDRQGYDENKGGYHRGQPPSYFSPYRIPTLEDGPPGEYLTDRETDEAIRFLEAHRDEPFFLSLPHYTVHTPLQAKSAKVEKYRAKANPDAGQRNATYAAMIESLDESTGRIMERLRELGLVDRTVVFFTSDNGGLTLGRPLPVTSNAPLRAGKGSSYEGGVRVPLIVKWPGVTTPGSVSDEPVITVDFFPTLLDIAQVATDARPNVDGTSLLPILQGRDTLERSAIFWHYPHYHPGGATPYGAVRMGDYKLIEFFEYDHVELYDLEKDLGETLNLANRMPWKADELLTKLRAWRQEVGAQMPAPNDRYDASTASPPPFAVRPNAHGVIVLPGSEAAIQGRTLRYEPQAHKNTLGYWSQSGDSASWLFHVDKPGRYHLEILQGCGPGQRGSEVEFRVGAQALTIRVEDTGGFQNFVKRDLGTMDLPSAGTERLEVRVKRKAGQEVMDLREVRLIPMTE